jgi:DNA-binding response OmpR family regulator
MSATSRVLVVDDEELSREPLAELLQQDGYTVDVAIDAASAGKLLAENRYDLLISDVNMPGNEKLEFVRDTAEKSPDIAIIVMTGQPTLQTSIESLRLRVVDYVVKPLQYGPFLELVKRALARAGVISATRQIREECSRMTQEVVSFEAAVAADAKAAGGQTGMMPEQLLDMTLAHIFRATLNFRIAHRMLQEKAHGENVDGGFCKIIGCPARTAYENGIKDAVQVLEATRGSFKSKELGDLRLRLESLLSKHREA